MPDDATVQKAYDNLDFMRGVDTFLNFIPATSIEGIRRGLVEIGLELPEEPVTLDGSDELFSPDAAFAV